MSDQQTQTAHGQRILVVEDVAALGADIQETLASAGYEVAGVVGSGEEAMRAAAHTRPELVLMAIGLDGEVDGIEAAEWIRRELAIPVIYLTAHCDEATLQRAMLTEPFGYIIKPVNKPELLANIRVALFRNQVEKAWRESEARYAAVVQQSSECILLADVDGGRILEANPAAREMLGYRPEELEGRTLGEILVSPQGEAARALQELGRSRPVRLGEQQYRASDGQLIDVEVSVSLISYHGSQVICAVARDTRERRQAERALAAAEDELEAQRALSLRAGRLHSLGVIARGIARGLAGPLGRVRAEMQEVQRQAAAGPVTPHLRQRLASLLDELDCLTQEVEQAGGTRRGARRDRLPVQVNEVVRGAMEAVGPALRAAGIELTCALEEGLPPVMADPFSLEEAVLGLLARAREAVRHRETPPPWVRVRTTLRQGPTEEVAVDVEDNGLPLPRQAAEHLLGPLLAAVTGQEGADLGLVVARAVVEQLDGRLEVQSLLEKATRVHIVLPAGV